MAEDLFSFSRTWTPASARPVTEKNTLDFSIDTGYTSYVQHPELDRYFIQPGSELSFDLNVGHIVVNFHDRPSIAQNSYQDPTISGGDYTRFENDAGFVANWDMNKLLLRLGYDHLDYITLNSSNLIRMRSQTSSRSVAPIRPSRRGILVWKQALALLATPKQPIRLWPAASGAARRSTAARFTRTS